MMHVCVYMFFFMRLYVREIYKALAKVLPLVKTTN